MVADGAVGAIELELSTAVVERFQVFKTLLLLLLLPLKAWRSRRVGPGASARGEGNPKARLWKAVENLYCERWIGP
jgi:hypothetical protein